MPVPAGSVFRSRVWMDQQRCFRANHHAERAHYLSSLDNRRVRLARDATYLIRQRPGSWNLVIAPTSDYGKQHNAFDAEQSSGNPPGNSRRAEFPDPERPQPNNHHELTNEKPPPNSLPLPLCRDAPYCFIAARADSRNDCSEVVVRKA